MNNVNPKPGTGPADGSATNLAEIHQALLLAFGAAERSGDLFLVRDDSFCAEVSSVPLERVTAGASTPVATAWDEVLAEYENERVPSVRDVQRVYVFAYSAAGQRFLEQVRERTEAHTWHIVFADSTGCIDTTATPAPRGPAPQQETPGKPQAVRRSVLERRLAAVEHARSFLAARPGQELPHDALAAASEALNDAWIQFGCLTWDDDAAIRLWSSVSASGPELVRPAADVLLACAWFLRGEQARSRDAFIRARLALLGQPGVGSAQGVPVPGGTQGQRHLRYQQQRLLLVVTRVVLQEAGKGDIPALIDAVMNEAPLE